MRFFMPLLLAFTLHATATAAVTEPADTASTVTDTKPMTIRPYDYFFSYLPVAAKQQPELWISTRFSAILQ